MKKAAIFLIFIAFISCKKDQGTSFKGDFVYYANAAVFQVGNDIHGVVLNDQANALAEQAKQYQQEPTDMVTIEVLGKLIPKKENEDSWPFKLKINKIVSVSALDPNKNDVIKLGK